MTLDYQRTLKTTAPPEKAYKAVTSDMTNWWTQTGGSFSKLGDVTTFRFPPNTSYWTFKSITLEPYTLVEHECVDALHIHDGLSDAIRGEWLGTILRFEIKPAPTGSDVTLTHIGLRPDLECYQICEAGWDFFFMKSLQAYLGESKGEPHMAYSIS